MGAALGAQGLPQADGHSVVSLFIVLSLRTFGAWAAATEEETP